jgi:hypothetical protein
MIARWVIEISILCYKQKLLEDQVCSFQADIKAILLRWCRKSGGESILVRRWWHVLASARLVFSILQGYLKVSVYVPAEAASAQLLRTTLC